MFEQEQPTQETSQESTQETSATSMRDFMAQQLSEPEPEQTAIESTEPVESEEEQQAIEPTEPAIKPPSSWKKELQAKFAELPLDIQQEIQRREDSFHNGIAQYKESAEYAKSLDPVANEILSLRQEFGSEQQGIKELYSLFQYAKTNPVAFIQEFAQSRGISLDGSPVQAQNNPQISNLEQQLRQVTSYIANQQQMTQQQQEQSVKQQIAEFASKPEYEHFDLVREEMAALLSSDRASDLADAYQQAIWLKPELRQKLITQQIEAEKAKAKKTAEEARKAGADNVRKHGVTQSQGNGGKSLKDILARQAETVGL